MSTVSVNPISAADGGGGRAAIYVSASSWAPLTRPARGLAEQSERCRQAVECLGLKRVRTYRNRYGSGGSGDWRKMIEDAVNRRFDVLVFDGAEHLGASERCAFFQLVRVMVPAGFRIVDAGEGLDSAACGGKSLGARVTQMARDEKRAARAAAEPAEGEGHGA